MPSGETHSKATLALAVTLTAAAPLYLPHLGPESLALGPGCLVGLLIHPDHDVPHGNISWRLLRHYFGVLPAAFWTLVWKPYALSVRHRSLISHSPVAGTLSRLLYLTLMLTVIFFPALTALAWSGHGPELVRLLGIALAWPGTWWAVTGLTLADALHVAMDHGWSRLRPARARR